MNPALSFVGIASLPSERANSSASVERVVGSGHAAHDLDQLHDLRRVEVVQAHNWPARPVQAAWSMTASEEVLVANMASGLTIRSTSRHISSFSGRLSVIASITRSHPASSRVVDGALHAPSHARRRLPGCSCFLDGARQLLLDLGDTVLEGRLVDLAQHHLITGLRGDLGDAMTHQPCSEHSHSLDLLRH